MIKPKKVIKDITSKVGLFTSKLKRINFESGPTLFEEKQSISAMESKQSPPVPAPRSESPAMQHINPNTIYSHTQISLMLSRLEEAGTSTTALSHAVRIKHTSGRTITFPLPEAVDRI